MSLLTACCAAQGGAPVPPVGCAYPLNGDITGAPFQPMTISGPGLQTATVAIAGNGTTEQYLSAPTGTFPGPFATLDFSTGIRVVGFFPAVPAAVISGSGYYAYRATFRTNTVAFSTVFQAEVRAMIDGTFETVFYVGETLAQTIASATCPTFIAFVFNANTSTVSALIDGVAVTLTPNTYTPAALNALILVDEFAVSSAGDTGKIVGGTIVTTAAQLSGAYPSGATDPCGNLI